MTTTFLTPAEALKNANNTTNQTIKSQFVQREVYGSVSQMVEYILKQDDSNAPFTFEDIENYYKLPEYNGNYASFYTGLESDRDAEIERLRELWNEADANEGSEADDLCQAIQAEIDELENLEAEPQEIMEWWLVSGWLFDKLKEQGEPVLECGYQYIWGRCTSGQSILLDYVISKICAEMGILEGQESSWAK